MKTTVETSGSDQPFKRPIISVEDDDTLIRTLTVGQVIFLVKQIY